MRINLSHCPEVSIPKRGCCERRTEGVVLISIAISSTRLRNLIIRLRASSLLIFVAGILASTFGGTFAFIGAGAVVTKPVPPYALVVGNPAKQIGWVSEFGHRLNFDSNGLAVCVESEQEYKFENNNVIRIK